MTKEEQAIELIIRASQTVLRSFATTPWQSMPRDEFEGSHDLHVRSLEALRLALSELNKIRSSHVGQ